MPGTGKQPLGLNSCIRFKAGAGDPGGDGGGGGGTRPPSIFVGGIVPPPPGKFEKVHKNNVQQNTD